MSVNKHEGASAISIAENLLEKTQAEVERLLPLGHTNRLERYVGLLHLAYTYIDDSQTDSRAELVGRIAACLRSCFSVGETNVDAPLRSDSPIAVICSYPRSGNTMVMRLVVRALHAQILATTPGSVIPFSKKIYPHSYPYLRLIKDHVPRDMFRDDRVAFLIRDGRDTMISLAYMTRHNGNHVFEKRGELASFIEWLGRDYPFGSWASHMRAVHSLRSARDDKVIIRYEDMMSEHQPFIDLVRFLDPEHTVLDDDLRAQYEKRDEIFDSLAPNPAWGIGKTFGPDSMFYAWSKARKGSSWRESWDAAAKQAFHETGATEFLIEHGYETDADWWRD